jgi:hypothetical protein
VKDFLFFHWNPRILFASANPPGRRILEPFGLKMVKINFYYKEGCWLCDAAQEMLNGQKERHNIVVRMVNIESDDDLYELYRFDIPVLEFRDGSTLNGRIKKKDLLKKLEENME